MPDLLYNRKLLVAEPWCGWLTGGSSPQTVGNVPHPVANSIITQLNPAGKDLSVR